MRILKMYFDKGYSAEIEWRPWWHYAFLFPLWLAPARTMTVYSGFGLFWTKSPNGLGSLPIEWMNALEHEAAHRHLYGSYDTL